MIFVPLMALSAIRPPVLRVTDSGNMHQASAWESTKEKLLAVAETYKKWGITFKVEDSVVHPFKGAFLPGKLNITGSLNSANELEINVATSVGKEHEMAIDVGGTYKIGPGGTTKSGEGSLFLGGSGLAGTFIQPESGEFSYDGSLKEGLYKLGIQVGKADEGPFSFGIELGGVSVEIDPTKYAERLELMAPKMLDAAGDKIGGVSLSVDADAMTYAIANASEAPPGFLKNRVAVSLKSIITGAKVNLEGINSVEGILVDDSTQDVFLIGTQEPTWPPIPTERLATIFQSVFLEGKHPFVSIDPAGGNFANQHVGRVGGIDQKWMNSSLINTMLHADYAMKQIVIGTHLIEGVPSTPDLIERYNTLIVPTRLWINPAPIRPGEVTETNSGLRRLYTISTSPRILTEALDPSITSSSSGDPTPEQQITEASKVVEQEEADVITQKFAQIADQWPDSGFHEAEQDLQLSNIASLLKIQEKGQWLNDLIQKFSTVVIPVQEIPKSFPALTSRPLTINGFTTGVTGGMITESVLPQPQMLAAASDDFLSHFDSKTNGESVDLGVPIPLMDSPQVVSSEFEAETQFYRGTQRNQDGDLSASKDAFGEAVRLKPNWELAQIQLIKESILVDKSYDFDDSKEIEDLIKSAEKNCPNSANLLVLDGENLVRAGGYQVLEGSRDLQWASAEEKFNSAIAINPSCVAAKIDIAKLNHRRGSDDQSLKEWNEAIKLDPSNTLALYGRAGLEAKLEENGPAMDDLNAILQNNPSYTPARLMKGMLDLKANDIKSAHDDFELAASHSAANWIVMEYLGESRYLVGDFEGAVQAETAALILVPKDPLLQDISNPEAPPKFSNIYVHVDIWDDFVSRSGDSPDPATTDLQFGGKPFDPLIFYARAEAYIGLKKYPEAKSDLLSCKPLLPQLAKNIVALLEKCQKEIDHK